MCKACGHVVQYCVLLCVCVCVCVCGGDSAYAHDGRSHISGYSVINMLVVSLLEMSSTLHCAILYM